MKVQLNTSQFKHILGEIAPIIKKTTIPIADCIKIQCITEREKNLTYIYGTNLEISKKIVSESVIAFKDNFTICVDFKQIYTLFKNLNDMFVDINISENEITIYTFNGSYDIPLEVNIDEFPVFPPMESGQKLEFTGEELKQILINASDFRGNDQLRPIMNGVNVSVKNGFIYATSTDAHKLKTIKISESDDNLLALNIPNPTSIFKNITAEIYEVIHTNTNVFFITPETTTVVRLIEGMYPNFWAVIPAKEESALVINIDKDEILNSLNRLSNIVEIDSVNLLFSISDNTIRIEGVNLDKGKRGQETISFDYSPDRGSINMLKTALFDIKVGS